MPASFLIGQSLMLFASAEIRAQKDRPWTTPFLLSLAYSAFIFIPVTAWFYYAHQGWSTVYLRPEYTFPWYAGPFIFFTYFLGAFLGGLLAQNLIQADRKRLVYLTLVLGFLWIGGVMVLTLKEYMHVGTYIEYQSGSAASIFDRPSFMNALNIMGAILTLPAIGLAFYFRKRGKSLR